MKPTLTLIALCLGSWITLAPAQDAPAKADPEAVKAAESLLDAVNMEKLMSESMATSLDAQTQQFAQLGMPPAAIEEIKKEMLDFLNEVMSWEELKPEIVRIYAESFTADELNELSTFYQTPTGKKAMSLMPQLMRQGMELGQEKVQARAQELNARITPIIQKHMTAPPQ